ncbi:hypothetical protein GJU39_11325 [Pedobacter petrophilus]|uniref:Uncharacterized protein n=1 Tax=Pedobacter petrophilus TaxID=1908241 RepID=A0A7K0FYL9_9SPHI|nr:hypothetical protein [Pedobacter petrophilus]MRX76678.1 hypothetical protein [Pedobacter petrophilus]
MGLILIFLYGFAIVALFIGGIITIIVKSSNNQPVKLGVQMLIASIVLVVIGGGACAVLLANS